MKTFAMVVIATALSATSALAIDVSKSVDVAAAPEAAWKAIGDFCGIATWHPAVAKCELSAKDGATMRLLTLQDGAKIFEKQLSFDGAKKSYAYAIVDAGPLPVANYESTLAVTAKGSGSTITWTGKFDAKGADDAKAAEAIGGVYAGGLESLGGKLK